MHAILQPGGPELGGDPVSREAEATARLLDKWPAETITQAEHFFPLMRLLKGIGAKPHPRWFPT